MLVNLPGSEHRAPLVSTKVRTQPCPVIFSNLPLTTSAACPPKNFTQKRFQRRLLHIPTLNSYTFLRLGPSLYAPLFHEERGTPMITD